MRQKADQGAIERLWAASNVRRQRDRGSGAYLRAGADRQRLRAQILEHLDERHRSHRVRPPLHQPRANHAPDRELGFVVVATATHLASDSLSALFDAVDRIRTVVIRRLNRAAQRPDLGFLVGAQAILPDAEPAAVAVTQPEDGAQKGVRRARAVVASGGEEGRTKRARSSRERDTGAERRDRSGDAGDDRSDRQEPASPTDARSRRRPGLARAPAASKSRQGAASK